MRFEALKTYHNDPSFYSLGIFEEKNKEKVYKF